MNVDRSPSSQTRFDRPPGWEWGTFENDAAARLRYGHAAPVESSRARIVLLTGFREFGEKYFETVQDLLALGYSVWQLDWYGQGGSTRHFANPQKIGAAGLESGVADLHRFVTAVVPDDSGAPLFAVSHSTGGLILLRYLHDHPDTFAAAAMSAPLFSLPLGGVWGSMARGLARLAVTSGFGSRYVPGAGDWGSNAVKIGGGPMNSHDPERRVLQDLWMRADPELRMGGVTFGWLDMAFRLTAESMRTSYLHGVSTPILIGSAGEDALVRSEAHGYAAERLPDAELVCYPGARHELFMERDTVRDLWLTEIDRFLGARVNRRQGRR